MAPSVRADARVPQARTVEDYEASLPWRIELPKQRPVRDRFREPCARAWIIVRLRFRTLYVFDDGVREGLGDRGRYELARGARDARPGAARVVGRCEARPIRCAASRDFTYPAVQNPGATSRLMPLSNRHHPIVRGVWSLKVGHGKLYARDFLGGFPLVCL